MIIVHGYLLHKAKTDDEITTKNLIWTLQFDTDNEAYTHFRDTLHTDINMINYDGHDIKYTLSMRNIGEVLYNGGGFKCYDLTSTVEHIRFRDVEGLL